MGWYWAGGVWGEELQPHWSPQFWGAEGVSRATARPRCSPISQRLGHCRWLAMDRQVRAGTGRMLPGPRPHPCAQWEGAGHTPERPLLAIPSCSPSSLPLRSSSSCPAEPQKEPLVCCVSCSSSEFYSAPLTLADRPQGKGQKDNCLQQFCPQLVSPSACRAAQSARHCLTNSIKFNSTLLEGGGGAHRGN